MEASRINAAVRLAVEKGMTTQDIGGKLGTKACAAWIAEQVGK